jgi:heme-degrading monooxygenase HmoA
MRARVVTNQLQSGKTDEWVEIFRDSIVAASRQQPGFRGALALTDATTDTGIGITFWESEAELSATEASGFYREQIAKVGQVVAAPPVRALYEVRVQL